ncbi:MAG: AarF/ABC1/UbiB kinase family protein [Candidatus Saccharibacteria bacterium]|nr:AarF/ABC1/UbiB kinase family protein [Pseudorhodobacter sp.]
MPQSPFDLPKASAVPGSSFARLAGLTAMVAGVGGRMVLGAARQVATGQRPKLADLLLTPTNAAKLTAQLAQMRGAALKVGQLMSMDTGDFVPPEFAAILARLRTDADHMPPQQLRTVLDRAWGTGWISRFARFDVRPIASASIGQVHRALTKDGRDLAIKVQYPGVRASIDSDVANLSGLLRLSGMVPATLDLATLLEQARVQLHEEADYVREGAQMIRYGAVLAANPAFKVPRLHADLSGADVLAMDFIDSLPIETLTTAPQAERDRVVTLLIRLALDEVFTFNLMQTDPNFANYRYDPASGHVVLLDFGATRSFDPDIAAQFRDLMAAMDREAIRRSAVQVGYFPADLAPAVQDRLLDMIEVALSALRQQTPFDFAGTDLVRQMRDMGFSLGMEREFSHVPPVDVLFLHRKIGGLFLLAQRLGARIPLAPLLAEFA